ncbi:hypothetical protein HYW60_02345 [Candidatus Kaiserbacteria bacterium]|nr:hypothetical protein [Candidatus Kaiserbacteria bacterium]
MPVIPFAEERFKRWLKDQLIAARKAQLSAAQAVEVISAKLEDYGYGRGFLPAEPLNIAPGLQSLRAVIAFEGNQEEVTIIVT